MLVPDLQPYMLRYSISKYAEERVLLWNSVEGIKISIVGAKQHIVWIGKIGYLKCSSKKESARN